jgi:nicotinamide mononucleotide transporter
MILNWMSDNWIEVFGAVTGIIYVFLEIRQNLWLWPVGITTSAVYIWVFFTGKLYADMTLQIYYLVISCVGWYWWVRGTGHRAQGTGQGAQGTEMSEGSQGDVITETETDGLHVSRLKLRTGLVLAMVFVTICSGIWLFLTGLTDSPVPEWDAVITSLSIVATWMLARKIYEHWYLWIVVNSVSMILFVIKGLYPTMILYSVYFIMSFVGLREWRRSL